VYAPASAFVLVEACRRAITGAPKARRELDGALLRHLHPFYRGYLVPQEGELEAPDGSRLLVFLLGELTDALQQAIADDTFDVAENERNEKLRAQQREQELRAEQRALAFFLGCERHPLGAEQAVGLALGQQKRAERTVQRYLDRAFVHCFSALPIRPCDVCPAHVSLAGFETCMSWLDDQPPRDAMPLIEAWRSRDLSPEVSRMILLLATLQGASARFGSRRNPVANWYAHHRHAPPLGPRVACPECPSKCVNGPRCLCRLRAQRLAEGVQRGRSERESSSLEQGQAAIEITAWRILRSHPRTWHSSALKELSWVLARNPMRVRRDGDPQAPRELAALGRLLGPGRVSQNDLREVAALIDATADHGGLEAVAVAALSAFGRRLAEKKGGYEAEVVRLTAGMAALGRSLSGAFRELRSPLLFEVESRLLSTGAQPPPKALESLQELPMAEQRNQRWQMAVYAYQLALGLVHRWLPEDRQKRWEIEEQLHLGRLGGLALEAEWLLFSHGRTSAAMRAHAQEIAKQALEMSGENGPLQQALKEAERLAKANQSHSSRHGAAPDDERLPDVLRYSPRWEVMPKIMRARAFVAQAASYTPREKAKQTLALAAARELLEELDRSDQPTPRHRWEMSRVGLVATIVEGDMAEISSLADGVALAGGDDGGDFAAVAASWRVRTLRGRTGARPLAEAAEHLADAGGVTPRLPDLQTIARAG
jgi:hypothetical protein